MNESEMNVVLSGRVRLARNYADLPFPSASETPHSKACIGRAVNAFADDSGQYSVKILKFTDATEQLALVESHLISRDLLKHAASAAVLIREDERVSIMVNEEDHLRIQAIVNGLDLETAAGEAFAVEEALARISPFSFDDQLGYLTACPTNTGTGLRASLMLHLPMLDRFKQMGSVGQTVAKLGLTLRGIYGEGSDALGSVYQVSNQITLGRTEQDIVEAVTAVGRRLIEMEDRLRQRCMQNSASALKDTIMRSYGLLRYAVTMDEKELMQHWSNLRLGASLELLPHSLTTVDRLLTTAQDAHVRKYMSDTQFTEVGEARCHLIRQTLAENPADAGKP